MNTRKAIVFHCTRTHKRPNSLKGLPKVRIEMSEVVV